MIRALHSEWTKLTTQRGTVVAVLAMCVLMVGMTTFVAAQMRTNPAVAGDDDVVPPGLTGAVFAALAAVVAGASLITPEYSTGMIRTTLTATPRRHRVLGAKAVVLALATFPPALVTSSIAFVVAQPLLRDRGYTAPAYPAVSLTDPGAVRAVAGTALLLTAYALIALGIGTVLRHTGATIATGFALIFLPVLMLSMLPVDLRIRVEQFSPLAGMAVQSTTDRMLSAFHSGGNGIPIGHWTGLAVTFAWALALLALGYARLRTRDA
jgi:ABC-2 type transport system permease protein